MLAPFLLLLTTAFWDGLTAGRYEVGFQSRWTMDETRSWHVAESRAPGGRPVRISMWYPAQSGGKAMTFDDYVHVAAGNPLDDQMAAANMRVFQRVLRTPEELQRLLSAPVAARSGAPRVQSRFPVVVYSSGWNEVWQHANFVLAEYLASHGYVVITVPQLPPTEKERTLGIDPVSMEAQVRDLEFALATVAKEGNADSSRVATMGHSMGGVAALLMAMRQPGVDAVIGLDASYGVRSFNDFIASSSYFRPRDFVVPLLDLRREGSDTTDALIDQLRFSDRYLNRFAGVQHADFTSFPQVALHFATDMEGRTPEEASRAYTTSAKTILDFLDARVAGRRTFDAPVARRAERRPLDESEWARIVATEGVDRALARHAAHPEDPIDEQRLNNLGYSYLADREFAIAIGIFRLNVAAHPKSANAMDSLAEGYLKGGRRDEALDAYHRVLELIGTDAALSAEQRTALERNAREILYGKPQDRGSLPHGYY